MVRSSFITVAASVVDLRLAFRRTGRAPRAHQERTRQHFVGTIFGFRVYNGAKCAEDQMPDVAIYLFGAPRIVLDGVSVTIERRKTLALLAYLAVTGRAHRREELITLLWPDLDARGGRAQLRNILVDLQRAIGKGWLDVEGDQVRVGRAGGDSGSTSVASTSCSLRLRRTATRPHRPATPAWSR